MAGGFQPPVYAAPLGAPFSERSLGKSLGLIAGFIESNLVNKRGKGIVLDILLGIAAR